MITDFKKKVVKIIFIHLIFTQGEQCSIAFQGKVDFLLLPNVFKQKLLNKFFIDFIQKYIYSFLVWSKWRLYQGHPRWALPNTLLQSFWNQTKCIFVAHNFFGP